MMTVDGITIPRDVESAGPDAIDAFVKTSKPAPKPKTKE